MNIIDQLIKVGTGEIPHIYYGLCPDPVEGTDVRDSQCPACKVIIEAEKLMKNTTPTIKIVTDTVEYNTYPDKLLISFSTKSDFMFDNIIRPLLPMTSDGVDVTFLSVKGIIHIASVSFNNVEKFNEMNEAIEAALY